MSESVNENIYLEISPVHGIFVANKSLDHKVTLQTQAEAVSFLLRDLNWKIPYVPQWVHTLTDTNLPSSTLRSQIWSISAAPDWTPPKMSEGKLIKALKQEFLLAMKVPFLLGQNAPSLYPWEWQCYYDMWCDGCSAGWAVGDSDSILPSLHSGCLLTLCHCCLYWAEVCGDQWWWHSNVRPVV